MSRLNTKNIYRGRTHEGGPAKRLTPTQELRRTMMATLLWEDNFYENGASVADRIKELVPKVGMPDLAMLAIEARDKQKLRHIPLLITREMARHWDVNARCLVGSTLAHVIQRPDELAEFLALYWKDGRTPLSAQVKKGLAAAFTKFDGFQLAKYNRDNAVKLRDVLFLSHAKPKDAKQAETWKKLVDGTLETPDTWEVELSKGKGVNKKESWERLLRENKMGAMALLRNLRNFREQGVDQTLVTEAITKMKADRVLPFRFISAAKYAPELEPTLEPAMFRALEGTEILDGHTVILIDVSGSMSYGQVSAKSELTRFDAAAGLAMLLREITEQGSVFAFSTQTVQLPPRRGFALRDALRHAPNYGGGTYLGGAIEGLNSVASRLKADRIIVLTDEQSADRVPDPNFKHAYMINVAAYQNGVGYGKWTHIDGWSEAIVDYIREYERSEF